MLLEKWFLYYIKIKESLLSKWNVLPPTFQSKKKAEKINLKSSMKKFLWLLVLIIRNRKQRWKIDVICLSICFLIICFVFFIVILLNINITSVINGICQINFNIKDDFNNWNDNCKMTKKVNQKLMQRNDFNSATSTCQTFSLKILQVFYVMYECVSVICAKILFTN